ncbi:hypothetical protein SORBI_3002G403833 [Sorghum bicolor]|nr:hypothetical protein SORBI_3002G403833 [Sorghum bicolor]
MGRSSEEGSRSRRMKSEAAEAKKASSEEGSLRPRTRSMKSEAEKASPEEGTRRRTRSMKSEAKKAKMASSEEGDKMAASEEEVFRILKLESEEDRKILMKVKSEEGKILKLKKEYKAASEATLDPPTVVPTVTAAQPAGKKTKKVLVKKLTTITKAQIDFTRAMATHPCPSRNLTEDQLAKYSESFQRSYRLDILLRDTRLAYLEALIDQQEKFGYAVDESEAEVTDDEGDDVVEVENY